MPILFEVPTYLGNHATWFENNIAAGGKHIVRFVVVFFFYFVFGDYLT